MQTNKTTCGFVAVVGRPNVGKSSLMNAILGEKISITTFRPQTTRHQVLGIRTVENQQTIYVDTPGMHQGSKLLLNKQMNKAARQALSDVDAIIVVIDATRLTEEDEAVLKLVEKQEVPKLIAVNKIDLLKDKTDLLKFIEQLAEKMPNTEIMPISALKKIQLSELENWVGKQLPESPFYFDKDTTTNQGERFRIAELIREKLMIHLSNELPYSLYVDVESMENKGKVTHINALIWVEREGQKKIIIGEKGQMLKTIGQSARIELEKLLKHKVCLKLWVKCKPWTNDVMVLKNLRILDK